MDKNYVAPRTIVSAVVTEQVLAGTSFSKNGSDSSGGGSDAAARQNTFWDDEN